MIRSIFCASPGSLTNEIIRRSAESSGRPRNESASITRRSASPCPAVPSRSPTLAGSSLPSLCTKKSATSRSPAAPRSSAFASSLIAFSPDLAPLNSCSARGAARSSRRISAAGVSPAAPPPDAAFAVCARGRWTERPRARASSSQSGGSISPGSSELSESDDALAAIPRWCDDAGCADDESEPALRTVLSAGSERDRSARSIRSNASGLSGLAIAQSPTAEEVSKHFARMPRRASSLS